MTGPSEQAPEARAPAVDSEPMIVDVMMPGMDGFGLLRRLIHTLRGVGYVMCEPSSGRT